ncbi:hypothetical protein N7456_012642 [Penicillium angulare]|uniref:Uncharacterized protein n=1 Tax=Penicillium angulare TaxID=116970 RepID=A0A9W9EK53_9EURO|nr:hypothetical protein N7456_012642 [Penicillium angulare]
MSDIYTFRTTSQPNKDQENTPLPQLTPNILPCQIHHDGPIESTDRFWTPVTDEKDGNETSHFRGRKLRGRRVAVPEGYQGVVAMPTNSVIPVSTQGSKEDPDVVEIQPGHEEPVKILQMQGKFNEIMVWGHEHLPAVNDTFVKGMEEWMRLAETVCLCPPSLVHYLEG